MATSTTVDTMMVAAMQVTIMATTPRPVTAPMLITPTTMTASPRRWGFWKEFDMRARLTRESDPH
eukprot:732030-Pyramimonas_sp.AAC.1